MMFASEITRICEAHPLLKIHFSGTFALNQLKSLKQNTFAIWNSSNDLPGIHWRTVIKRDEHLIELYDSLGITQEESNRLLFKIDQTSRAISNSTRLQPKDSENCGKFCIYFILNRYMDWDLEFNDVLNEIFSLDQNENDKKVLEFLKEFEII